MPLSDRDRAILDLERTWWTLPVTKEAAIRTRLAMSATGYYKALQALVDSPEAAAYDPLVVRRLRVRRDRRRRERYEGRASRRPQIR